MRRMLLATIAILTLLVPAAWAEGRHIADGNSSASEAPRHENETQSEGSAHVAQNESAENETAEHHENATHENRSQERTEERIEERHENKTVERAERVEQRKADDAMRDKLDKARASFIEGVTALVQGCKAEAQAEHANNTTQKEIHRSWATCLSNGFQALKIQLRAEKHEIRAERRAQRDAA